MSGFYEPAVEGGSAWRYATAPRAATLSRCSKIGEGHEPGPHPSSHPSDLTVMLCKPHGDQGLHTQHLLGLDTGPIERPPPPPEVDDGAVQDPVSEVTVQAPPACPTTVLLTHRDEQLDVVCAQTANVLTAGPGTP